MVNWIIMGINYSTVGEMKEGSYIVIDGEPCRVVEVTKAKTGKHGSAKANIIAVSIFTGAKRPSWLQWTQQWKCPSLRNAWDR